MAASMPHAEISSRYSTRHDSVLHIEPHLQYDRTRSRTNNQRAFNRYLGMLRALHSSEFSMSVACFVEPDKCCVVCHSRSDDLFNMHHRKGGPLFPCSATPEGLAGRGFFVEVEEPVDDDSGELMMCSHCLGHNNTGWVGTAHAETILRRNWKRHRFPFYRSMLAN